MTANPHLFSSILTDASDESIAKLLDLYFEMMSEYDCTIRDFSMLTFVFPGKPCNEVSIFNLDVD